MVNVEERNDVPKANEELRHRVFDRVFAVNDGVPRRLVREEVPTERVGAVFVEDFLRQAVVLERFRHLADALGELALAERFERFFFGQANVVLVGVVLVPLGEHQPKNDAVLERVRERFRRVARRFVAEKERRNRELRIEPTARLVDRFADEVRREVRFEQLFRAFFVRIAELRERHRAGVEPAVDDFRNATHLRARRFRRIVNDRVDIRLVNFEVFPKLVVFFAPSVAFFGFSFVASGGPNVGSGDARLREEFVVRADRFLVAGFFADPNRERRSPETFAGKGPVDVRREEVPETPVFDVFREPVDFGVVREHLVDELRRFDEPALARVLNERVVRRAPAERIIVQVLFEVEQNPAFFEVARNVFVAFLDPAAFVIGRRVGEFPVGGDGADQVRALTVDEARLLLDEKIVVDFAERRSFVNEPGSGVGRNEERRANAPSEVVFAAVFEGALLVAERFVIIVERRDVTLAEQVFAGNRKEDFRRPFRFRRDRFDERRRENDRVAVRFALGRLHLNDRIFEVGVNRRELVARERPRRRRPNEEVDVRETLVRTVVQEREADENARVADFAVTLADFAGRKRGAALRPPPNDLVPLVEQAAVEEVLQREPNAFDKRLMIGNVSVFQVDPKADALGQLFPLRRVTEDVFDATVNERFEAELFDFFLRVFRDKSRRDKLFADFDFDRKTVRVPTGLAFAEVALHRLVARIKVFDGAS